LKNTVTGLDISNCLGKDESPGSNPGLGFFPLFSPVRELLRVPVMIRTQGREPGGELTTPTEYSDYSNFSGSLDKEFKCSRPLVLDSRYGVQS